VLPLHAARFGVALAHGLALPAILYLKTHFEHQLPTTPAFLVPPILLPSVSREKAI
jgi:hypothetical protein